MAKQETVITKNAETGPLAGTVVPEVKPGFNPGRALRNWAGYELRLWQRAFKSPAPYALLIGVLMLFSLAWQVPFSYTLDSANDLRLDQPFLKNLNATERTPEGQYFRWTKGEGTVDFPGVGKHAYRFEITAADSYKPGSPYVLYANETKIAEGKFEPGIKTYDFQIPPDAVPGKNGNLRLTLQAPGVIPSQLDPASTEKRELGFPFFSARVTPTGDGPTVPPFTQLGWLVGAVMLAYFLLARAGFAPWKAATAAAVLALLPAGVIASPGGRPWLTIFSDKITFAFGWALLLVVLADIPLRRIWQYGWERSWVLSIFGMTLALHLLGLLHPQAESNSSIVDLGFHLHRFEALWDRGAWWDKIQSAEWGGRFTYYPHLTYLLMGPFNLVIPDRRLLLLLWMTTFEASRVLLIFYLVKRVTGQGRAAVLAAFFMAALPVNTLSLAWGQVANLMGEWFILAALCLVAVKWDRLRRPHIFALLTLALMGSFLVHPGEVVVSGVVFLAIGVILWLRRESRQQATVMLGAFLLAVVLAVGSYHWMTIRDMVPQALDSLSNKVQGKPVAVTKPNEVIYPFYVGGSVGDSRLGMVKGVGVNTVGELITGGLKGFWTEARVYYAVFPLLFLPFGLAWLWWSSRKRQSQDAEARRRLFWIGLAWTGTAVVFALVGLLLNLYVRYSLFLLPVVALCAGIFLHRLWARLEYLGRGWAAGLVTFALGAWITLGTATLFLDRMIYYGH